MYFSKSYNRKALVLFTSVLMLFLTSCVTYNQRISDYYHSLSRKDYSSAEKALQKNKLLKRKRNQLLYNLEMGKLAHIKGDYQESNRLLNEADLFMEDARTSLNDVAVSNLINPMMAAYKGEDFEKFMVHYYKALNYLYLGDIEAAVVEARRISLKSFELQDNNKENKYNDDAFSLMLQGMLYEVAGDWNNAFISYRNAADIYLNNNLQYYGVPMPEQLKQDLLHMAYVNGFTDLLQFYEKQLQTSYNKKEISEGGELILFWENGLAPVKTEQNFFFSLTNAGGQFMFTDISGTINIPFYSTSAFNPDADAMKHMHSFRIAFPKYMVQEPFYKDGYAELAGDIFSFELAEDLNTIAVSTLKERFLKEAGKALSRQAVKKLIEYSLRPSEDDKNKNEKNALATTMQLYSLFSEKADTRNWQSLPQHIFYTRIPLLKGENKISVNLTGMNKRNIEILVPGNGAVQIRNISTLTN